MIITIENEELCPGVITDKIHLPSPAIPLSVPVAINVVESGLGIVCSGGDVLPHINGSHVEAIEI